MENDDEFHGLDDLKISDVKITYKLRKRENPQLLAHSFIVGDFLGEGVSAKVYEALDMTTLQRRALKLYEFRRIFKLHNYEERVEMLKTEIRLLSKLEHRHLIKYVDVYTNQRQCAHHRDINIYAIMEYCVCCVDDLMEAYPERRLPIGRAHKYFVQLVQAVEYLHSQGIIHKDIKTSNMLIDLKDDVKLIDLGVCEVIDQFAQRPMCSKTNGSFIYQAPEMFDVSNREFAGDAVDVWACGVTLYFMLAGTFPFEGKLLELMAKVARDDFLVPPHLQPETHLVRLLRAMLRKEPQRRATIAEIQADPWVCSDPNSVLQLHRLGLSWFGRGQSSGEPVLPKPRTKYEDIYRSMSITPYLHQLHYPIEELQNQVEVSEEELDEFENLRRIPLVRSNRNRSGRRRMRQKNIVKLYEKLSRIMGLKTVEREPGLNG